VLLVAESAGLAAVLHHLLDPADRLSRIGSMRELAESRALEAADVVVLDVPPEDRVAAVGQVRRRYLGPLVVLVARTDGPGGPRPDDACRLLPRPFSAEELGAALAGPGLPGVAPTVLAPAPPAEATADPVDPADPKAAARRAPVQRAAATPPGQLDLVDRVLRLLAALTQGWQAKRRVRVAGFSAFALVAFTVAFAVAAQGGRCGPGCDAFGTGFSPAPTIAPASSLASSTTGPKRGATSTTVPSGSPATGAFQGISGAGGRVATTSTTRAKATTTTRRPATTRPATTRPVTTQTTAPVTTTTEPPPPPPPTTAGA
jgi:hypothetical protein